MKTNSLILFSIVFIVAVTTWLFDQRQITQPAPDFNYQTIYGEQGFLYDHQGKKIILHFWATWCAPCIVEFPELIELGQKHPEKLEILAVSIDKNAKDIKKFLSQNKISLPKNIVMIHDPSQNITKNTYSVQKFPESFLLDINLHIQKRIIGANQNWASTKLDKFF